MKAPGIWRQRCSICRLCLCILGPDKIPWLLLSPYKAFKTGSPCGRPHSQGHHQYPEAILVGGAWRVAANSFSSLYSTHKPWLCFEQLCRTKRFHWSGLMTHHQDWRKKTVKTCLKWTLTFCMQCFVGLLPVVSSLPAREKSWKHLTLENHNRDLTGKSKWLESICRAVCAIF